MIMVRVNGKLVPLVTADELDSKINENGDFEIFVKDKKGIDKKDYGIK